MKEYIIKIADEPDITGGYALQEKAKELVRCKDCKYGKHIVSTFNGEVIVYRIFCSKRGNASHEPDWFCADGERRID